MSSGTFSYAVWGILGATAVGLQLLGLCSRHRFPTLGDTVGFALRGAVARGLVLLGWVWLGIHVFAR